MSVGIEAVEGLRFLDATLRASSTFMAAVPGGLWHGLNTSLPQGVFPDNIFCVYQHMAGSDDMGGGGIRIGTTGVFLVKVVGPGSNVDAIQSVTNLMDAALQGASGTTANGLIYYFLRQSSQVLPQIVNARLALSTLSQYRSYLQGS